MLCVRFYVPGPDDPDLERDLLELAGAAVFHSTSDEVEAEVLFGSGDVDVTVVSRELYDHSDEGRDEYKLGDALRAALETINELRKEA